MTFIAINVIIKAVQNRRCFKIKVAGKGDIIALVLFIAAFIIVPLVVYAGLVEGLHDFLGGTHYDTYGPQFLPTLIGSLVVFILAIVCIGGSYAKAKIKDKKEAERIIKEERERKIQERKDKMKERMNVAKRFEQAIKK